MVFWFWLPLVSTVFGIYFGVVSLVGSVDYVDSVGCQRMLSSGSGHPCWCRIVYRVLLVASVVWLAFPVGSATCIISIIGPSVWANCYRVIWLNTEAINLFTRPKALRLNTMILWVTMKIISWNVRSAGRRGFSSQVKCLKNQLEQSLMEKEIHGVHRTQQTWLQLGNRNNKYFQTILPLEASKCGLENTGWTR